MSISRGIAVVGAKETGKTSLITQWAVGSFPDKYSPAKSASARVVRDTLVIEPMGIDQKKITDSLFDRVQGGLLVFSVADKHSFDVLPEGLKKMREHIKGPIILVGNKSDLERAVSSEVASKFAQENDLVYLEVSAKDKAKVDTVFNSLLEKLVIDTLIAEVHPAAEVEEKKEIKLDGTLDEQLRQTIIADIRLQMKGVGKSREELKSELVRKCEEASSIEDIINALKDCGDQAQKDHKENSGAKLFVFWGPTLKSTSRMSQVASALIEKYKSQPSSSMSNGAH